MRKKKERFISKPHAHLHSMQKTSAKFQNIPWKTVRGVAPTRHPLSIHFDNISYKKRLSSRSRKSEKNNERFISKPHAYLHSMQKTSAKFQNIPWKTVRGAAPTRYPVYFHLKGYRKKNDGGQGKSSKALTFSKWAIIIKGLCQTT